MKKYILLLSISVVFSAQLLAQESTLMHFMHWSPVSMRSNPVNLEDTTRYYLGIPFLSNINASLRSPFSYSDAIYRNPQNDSLHINHNIVDQLTANSNMSVDVAYELISFGIRFREDNMITFSLSAKTFGTFFIPKDAVSFILDGNTPGQTIAVDGDVNATAYVEAALGYTRRIDDNWKVGGRVKYIAGLANAFGKNMRASIYTNEENYGMTMKSDAFVQTSYLDPSNGIFSNSGAGFDLGASYKTPIEGLKVDLSLVDWGWISWNSKLKSYRSFVKNGAYTFNGLNGLDDSFDAVLDTLKEVFKFEESENTGAYTSTLPGKIFLGASYNLTAQDKFGFLFSTRALQNFKNTTFTLMYNRQVGQWFSVAVGNNFMLDKVFNPSLALLFRAKGFQFHIAAENISNYNVKDMTGFNIQFGMNIAVWSKY